MRVNISSITLLLIISMFFTFPRHATCQVNQFGGPDRNGIYPDTGLMDQWPEGGPELLATFSGIGEGYGSPAVNKDGVYIAGMIDSIGHVFHFNHDQELLWQTPIGKEFTYRYIGSRGTPTIDGDRLYYVASMGEAACLNTKTGEKIWSRNTIEEFNGPEIKWGYTESPLVYEDKVFLTPGGPHKNFIALDKMTGELIWAADFDSTYNVYCSPLIVNHNGEDLILVNTSDYLLMLKPGSGEPVVKHPITHSRENHTIPPIYDDGKLFYASGYGEGATLFQIKDGQLELDTIYRNDEFDPRMSGIFNYDGVVYGFTHRRKMWMGVDYETGETLFQNRDYGRGCLILADDKFYIYTDKGDVSLALPAKTKIELVSQFQIPAGTATFAFAYPVIYDGKLYIRYNNDLWVYKIQ
ncbi:MAG TPA: PQQ-binding-like beta-propeller repeat protein [Bacteroidales bacterium]|nr:PQQ-binding-like beta-propeller repeat protein [Bacteroidales bacterium]